MRSNLIGLISVWQDAVVRPKPDPVRSAALYGECSGLYTYETIMGGSVTLPKFEAETVSFD